MINTFNQVTIVGFVHDKATFNYFDNGSNVGTFVVKTHYIKRPESGAGYTTDFELTRCTVWNNVAPHMETILIPGNKIFLTGKLRTTKYKDKKGHWVFATQVIVDQLILEASKV